ncbi:MAG: hypothetical protein M9962_14925 [Oligoflexia bacterium]|nr:hypothetical protein [Oligoflexia bacterium]
MSNLFTRSLTHPYSFALYALACLLNIGIFSLLLSTHHLFFDWLSVDINSVIVILRNLLLAQALGIVLYPILKKRGILALKLGSIFSGILFFLFTFSLKEVAVYFCLLFFILLLARLFKSSIIRLLIYVISIFAFAYSDIQIAISPFLVFLFVSQIRAVSVLLAPSTFCQNLLFLTSPVFLLHPEPFTFLTPKCLSGDESQELKFSILEIFRPWIYYLVTLLLIEIFARTGISTLWSWTISQHNLFTLLFFGWWIFVFRFFTFAIFSSMSANVGSFHGIRVIYDFRYPFWAKDYLDFWGKYLIYNRRSFIRYIFQPVTLWAVSKGFKSFIAKLLGVFAVYLFLLLCRMLLIKMQQDTGSIEFQDRLSSFLNITILLGVFFGSYFSSKLVDFLVNPNHKTNEFVKVVLTNIFIAVTGASSYYLFVKNIIF